MFFIIIKVNLIFYLLSLFCWLVLGRRTFEIVKEIDFLDSFIPLMKKRIWYPYPSNFWNLVLLYGQKILTLGRILGIFDKLHEILNILQKENLTFFL